MNALVCEMCGSHNLTKRDGMFVCDHCGTKYTVEEAKKLFGVVKIDRSKEIDNLLVLARRAREEGNNENSEKYYGMLLQEDPNNWEAAFFQVYFRAMQCKVGEISYYADVVSSALQSVAELLYGADEAERMEAIRTITVPSLEIADLFASVAVSHYEKFMTADGAFTDCVNAVVNASVIVGGIEIIIKEFCDDKNILASAQRAYVSYLSNYKKFFKQDYLNTTINRLSNEIRQVDPSYTAPTISGGCYVATAVYGSYDCPEVWTLRRFRDNSLAEKWSGRVFIRFYYAVSPILVKLFGNTRWFKAIWKVQLDKMVKVLQQKGFECTPYQDKVW